MVRKHVLCLAVILPMIFQIFNIFIYADEKYDLSIIESFNNNKETSELKVKEIDLGDIQKEMEVDETQMLTPAVLPSNANIPQFNFKSNNEKVATVNGFGRITAHSVGQALITVEADGVTESFTLKVNEKSETSVKDIELGEYTEVMEAGKSQDIIPSIIPPGASDSNLEYNSSNKEVASISSSGVLKALKKGETIITVKAGKISKQFKIKVEAATTAIDINKTFVILKTGDQFQLKCKVLPQEASQLLKFKSTDNSVVAVDQNGLITAVNQGEATVIVSNGYMDSTVNTIVNKDVAISSNSSDLDNKSINNEDQLIKLLDKSDTATKLSSKDLLKVSKQMLKHLYNSKGTLIIEDTKYNIILNGSDIVNFENELLTNILFKEEKSGIELIINDKKDLPGKINLLLKGKEFLEKDNLYLFNDSKNKFELLINSKENGMIKIDVPGRYLLAKDKIVSININIGLFIAASLCIFVIAIAYFLTKKKYWFW